MVVSFVKRTASPWAGRGYSWIGFLVMAVWLGVVGVAGAQAEDRGVLTGSVTDGQGTPVAEPVFSSAAWRPEARARP